MCNIPAPTSLTLTANTQDKVKGNLQSLTINIMTYMWNIPAPTSLTLTTNIQDKFKGKLQALCTSIVN